MIRILLIEDFTLVRESLAIALATDTNNELSCRPSIEEGIDLLNESSGRFDILLLEQNGGQKADQLLSIANRNGLKVLVMTTGLTDLEHRRLVGLGVSGIFAKRRSLGDLVHAIRAVADGQAWFYKQPSNEDTPKDPASWRARPIQSSEAADFAFGPWESGTLSRQERRAAEFVWAGLANKEIAVRMDVSESCIKALLQRAFLKLGVHTRGQLVRVLMESLIRPQSAPDTLMEFAPSMDGFSAREATHSDLTSSPV